MNWLIRWMHRNQAEDEPCPHIKPHLNGIADGSMPEGGLRRFVRHHLKDCSYCQNALFNLVTLRERLFEWGHPHPDGDDPAPLDPERRAAISAAWDAVDAATPDPPAAPTFASTDAAEVEGDFVRAPMPKR